MNILVLFLIIFVVLFGFGFIAYESETKPQQVFSDDIKNLAKSLTTDFPDGAQIKFALDPQPPVTEFVYEDREVVTQIKDENGTVIDEVTTTEKVRVESSGELLTTADGKKICNIGYNCPIEGNIQLVNLKGEPVDPPYGFFLEVGCEKEEWCNHDRTVMVNDLTDHNGGFKYNWYTSQIKDHLGNYEATVHIRSAYEIDGERFTYDPIPLQIELIE